MKLIVILLSITVIISCGAKQPEGEADIYEFVNQVLAQTTPVDYKKICCVGDKALYTGAFTEEDSIELLKMDTFFTVQDISSMMEQAKSLPDFKCKGELIKGKRVISLDTLNSSKQLTQAFWRQLSDRHGIDEFVTVSKPIFSKDKTKVIVTLDYYTSRGGGGETTIYRKENGKWKYSKMLRYWDN